MQDFEKLGVFYLGKPFDIDKGQPLDEPLLYESKDLTTHALCVGMTGSGKTGLCLSLLEEAAIDGIPAICIDPKGDLGNLLLAFPNLAPEDFQPWLDPAEATRQGVSVEDLAKQTAQQWQEGLAAWGQDAARVARFKDAVDVAIYTPGSNAGLPLTVLRSFNAPGPAILNDADALRERINAAASGLLALLGVEADPLRSREHILLSSLLDRAWRENRNLEMGALIRELQTPPFDKVGVMDLESFFPAKERFALAMSLNNLLASPGFSSWMEGEPLDVQRLLFTPAGKPRLSIVSIAHLSEAERMFFVTILLNEVVAWMRTQSGTSSLRALLYMDEVFGYFPPSANPPSKTPMLTLLKQARAYGLGVVLATQNPVDLDYKGLSNAGTWFLGRLQTERDKLRVLDGLEGASTAAGAKFDRAKTEAILSGLGNRVFLMNNVHEDGPVVFQSRWALSFLRGPLTRDQIGALMKPRKVLAAAAPTDKPAVAAAAAAGARPVLPPGVPECFQPLRAKPAAGQAPQYSPSLLGVAKVHFVQAIKGIDAWQDVSLVLPLGDSGDISWDEVEPSLDGEPENEKEPAAGATFGSLPAELMQAKRMAALSAELKDRLYRTHKLTIYKCPLLKQFSNPGESEGDFRARLAHGSREQRDEQKEKLRAKLAPKLAAVEEQIRKAKQRVEKEKAQANQQVFSSILSVGSSFVSAMFSRKLASSANVGRVASSVRAASRVSKEKTDVGHAEESVEALQQKLADLNEQFQADLESLVDRHGTEALELESIELQPKKSDIAVSKVVIYWQPA